jgi:hypothetical protein
MIGAFRSMTAGLALVAVSAPALAQQGAPVPPPSAPAQALKEGTEVHLVTRDAISSETAKAGDRIELRVAQAVVVDGTIVIPEGAAATGEVTKARDNGLLGRSGKLDIAITSIDAGGRSVPVRGQKDKKGSSGTIGAVGAGVVFLPLAIVVKGKEAKIPAGTTVDVYVDRDVPFVAGASTAAEPPIVGQPAPVG